MVMKLGLVFPSVRVVKLLPLLLPLIRNLQTILWRHLCLNVESNCDLTNFELIVKQAAFADAFDQLRGPPWLGRGWFGHLEALNTPFVFFEKGGKMANHLVRQRLPRCQSKVRSSRPILMRRCRWTVQTLARRY